MVYIGVDLHRKKSQVAALDQDGQLLFNRKIRTGPAEMQQVIDELRPRPVEVAFEATFGWVRGTQIRPCGSPSSRATY